jgi:hypothetical protein
MVRLWRLRCSSRRLAHGFPQERNVSAREGGWAERESFGDVILRLAEAA